MNQQERLNYLLDALTRENPEDGAWLREQYGDTFAALRGLMNIRPPQPCDSRVLEVQDAFLQEMTREKGIVSIEDLEPVDGQNNYLWRGDITRLQVDAIVNAANSRMLGCWHPNHGCIDNIIHTMSGMQLRAACSRMMEQQGHEEPTGCAKRTPAFNLPCRYVLHTVGPIVHGTLMPEQKEELASCYRSCLEQAEAGGVQSIAFCCISTGVFGFPASEAAQIAVETVDRYREQTGSTIKVLFNVFKESDETIYRDIFLRRKATELQNRPERKEKGTFQVTK